MNMTGVSMIAGTGNTRFGLCAVLALLLLPLGCGGGQEAVKPQDLTDDQKEIIALVGGVSDVATELTRLRSVFTKDAAPSQAEMKDYSSHYFQVTGDVSVTGDTATIPVKVASYSSDSTANVTWKAAKDSGKWKLTDAPVK
jgi:hypothetical protein